MSLLNKKVQGTLPDGKYICTFIGAKELPATDTCNERVQINLQTSDGRNLVITAFEKQLEFYTRDLINAYAPGQELSFIEAVDVADELVVTKYTVHTEDIDGNDKTYVNYSFNPAFIRKDEQGTNAAVADVEFN